MSSQTVILSFFGVLVLVLLAGVVLALALKYDALEFSLSNPSTTRCTDCVEFAEVQPSSLSSSGELIRRDKNSLAAEECVLNLPQYRELREGDAFNYRNGAVAAPYSIESVTYTQLPGGVVYVGGAGDLRQGPFYSSKPLQHPDCAGDVRAWVANAVLSGVDIGAYERIYVCPDGSERYSLSECGGDESIPVDDVLPEQRSFWAWLVHEFRSLFAAVFGGSS